MQENYIQLLAEFKDHVINDRKDEAAFSLMEIKKIMLDMDSLPPVCENTINAEKERLFARQTLEYACILSVILSDKESFQRHIASLRPYYNQELLKRPDQDDDIINIILGLNLLYLLVENRLADFHCELELLTESQQTHPAITFCIQLDKHLVVGSYDQVLKAAAQPPIPYYAFFLKSLLETVRVNIGECVSASYTTLSVSAATSILMFDNENDTIDFVTTYYPDWVIDKHMIHIIEAKVIKSDEIPSLKLISQTLQYATELERIV